MIKTIITLFGIYTASSNRLLLQQFQPIQPVAPNPQAQPPPFIAPGAPQFVPIPLPSVTEPNIAPPQPPQNQPPVAVPAIPSVNPEPPVVTAAPPLQTEYVPQAPPPGQFVPEVPAVPAAPAVPAVPAVPSPPANPAQIPPANPAQVPPANTAPFNAYAVPPYNPYAPPPMAPRKIECKYAPPDAQSCANKMTTVKNPDLNFEVTCSGYMGCMNSRVTVNYDQFTSPMLETFKGFFCKNEYACMGAVFQFVNHRQGDKIIIDQIKCDKPGACQNTQFILGPMMELEHGDFYCAPQACQGCVVKENPGDIGKPCWEYTEWI